MAEMKTKKNRNSPEDFLNTIKEEQKRKDAFAILEIMKKASKAEPKMWGSAIIGFGDYYYTLSNGKKNDWFKIGFSPRKQNFSFYLFGEKTEKYYTLLTKLGKYSMEKGCWHVKKMEEIDVKVLQQLCELQVSMCK